MIKNDNIVISQSITKDLGLFVVDDQVYEMDFCPHKVYRKHILNDYPESSSEPMMYGKYGETHLLGGSAKGSSQWALPEKKRGGRSVKQDRIDIMIQRLYGYMQALGIEWSELNTQVPLIAKYSDHVWIRGEMDIFPVKVNGQVSIVDTKFTKSIDNIFSSIKEDNIRHSTVSCWGAFEDIQKNQPLMYHFLARNFQKTGLDNLIRYNPEKADTYSMLFNQNIDYSDTNFYFLVAGYDVPDISKQLNHYAYEWTTARSRLLDHLMETSIRKIQEGIAQEWNTNPKSHLCRGCALRDTCLK